MKKQTYAFITENEIKHEVARFRRYLKRQELATNTITSYTHTIARFLKDYHNVTKENAMAFKAVLMEENAPSTVNLRIQGLRKYFRFLGINIEIHSVHIQNRPYLENVISMQEYKYLKKKLSELEDLTFYFLLWGMACTGARISEILKVKAENVMAGKMDFYGKGKKYRRIYFIKRYQKECVEWINTVGRTSGNLFIKPDGTLFTEKYVERQLKIMAKRYNIDPEVMYPHSFRHLFGKTFYDKYKDLPLLSDLLGHSNIATTQIYTRRTSTEQAEIMNKVVNW